MPQGECKFCGNASKLIKAHVIPAGLYDKDDTSQEALMVLSSSRPERVSKSWTGIYDNQLVCRACENQWDSWDSYAVNFLRHIDQHSKPITHGNRLIAYQADQFDYGRLKLFFLSVAWRCSASNREEFKLVDLGPYEALLKDAIKTSNPDHPAGFEITVSRFDDTKLGTILLNPHCERHGPVNYLRLYMYGYIVLMKTDKRPGVSPFTDLQMIRDRPLVIGLREFEGGPEHRLIRRMAKDVQG
jgi:hypothetical protein|tara:strand:+ start:2029 stop:2757 length:729 start_codon:yes stop_codon:yes gene_type:complete